MLHETAVAWVARRMVLTTPVREWEETLEDFGARLKAACQYCNDNYDVDGLCRALPGRLATLIERAGARTGK